MLKFPTEKIAWTNSLDIICGEIFRYSSLPLFLLHLCSCLWLWRLSGNPIWICWGRPQWLMHPGHTLIPADLRVFFFIPRLSESWKPCPARCLETRLLPVSHPAVASGDRIGSLGLEFDLESFRTPVEEKKNRKLTVVIELLHPSRHPRALYTLLPLKPKHQGVTWNLSMCLTDVGSFLHDFKKPGVQLRDLFHCISDTRLSDCSPSLGRYPQCCILWWGESIKTLCTPGACSCLQHQPLIFLFFSLSLSQRKKLHIRSVVL